MAGDVESAVRADVAALGELTGTKRSLAESAYALARALDEGAGMSTAAIARELRATLESLSRGCDDDDNLAAVVAELSSPVRDTPN